MLRLVCERDRKRMTQIPTRLTPPLLSTTKTTTTTTTTNPREFQRQGHKTGFSDSFSLRDTAKKRSSRYMFVQNFIELSAAVHRLKLSRLSFFKFQLPLCRSSLVLLISGFYLSHNHLFLDFFMFYTTVLPLQFLSFHFNLKHFQFFSVYVLD